MDTSEGAQLSSVHHRHSGVHRAAQWLIKLRDGSKETLEHLVRNANNTFFDILPFLFVNDDSITELSWA